MKSGDIIAFSELGQQIGSYQSFNGHKRKGIAFYVSARHLAKGVNAPKPGFYGFYGLTRDDDPLNLHSYAKINCVSGRKMGRLRARNSRRFFAFNRRFG